MNEDHFNFRNGWIKDSVDLLFLSIVYKSTFIKFSNELPDYNCFGEYRFSNVKTQQKIFLTKPIQVATRKE